jgi:hypothetical protein
VSFEHWSYVPTEGLLPAAATVTVGDRVVEGLSCLGLSVVVVATVVVVEATVDVVVSFVDVACVLDVVESVVDVVGSVVEVLDTSVDVELLIVSRTDAGETPAAAAPSANSARLRTAPAKRRRQALAFLLGLRLMISSRNRAPRRRRRL